MFNVGLLLTSVATLANSILIYSVVKKRHTKVAPLCDQTYFKLYFNYVGLEEKCALLENEIRQLKMSQ